MFNLIFKLYKIIEYFIILDGNRTIKIYTSNHSSGDVSKFNDLYMRRISYKASYKTSLQQTERTRVKTISYGVVKELCEQTVKTYKQTS